MSGGSVIRSCLLLLVFRFLFLFFSDKDSYDRLVKLEKFALTLCLKQVYTYKTNESFKKKVCTFYLNKAVTKIIKHEGLHLLGTY